MKRHLPSAKRVSNARDDLPEPDGPTIVVMRLCGMRTEMFLRLFCLSPSIMSSSFSAGELEPPSNGRTSALFVFFLAMRCLEPPFEYS